MNKFARRHLEHRLAWHEKALLFYAFLFAILLIFLGLFGSQHSNKLQLMSQEMFFSGGFLISLGLLFILLKQHLPLDAGHRQPIPQPRPSSKARQAIRRLQKEIDDLNRKQKIQLRRKSAVF